MEGGTGREDSVLVPCRNPGSISLRTGVKGESKTISQFSGPSLNRMISLVVNRIIRQTHLATIYNPKRSPNLEGSLRAMISQARIHSSAHGGSSVCVVVVTRRTEHPPTVMRGQMSGWRTVSVRREVSTRGSLSVQGVLVGTV